MAGSSEAVYEAQRRETARVLAGGHAAIADGVFLRMEERDAIEAVARDSKAPFQGVWLQAAPAALLERVEARSNDPSDATVDVVRLQQNLQPGRVGWTIFGTDRDASATLAEVQRRSFRQERE